MEYKTRNQLILFIFNVLIGVLAAVLFFYYFPSKKNSLARALREVEKSLAGLSEIESQVEQTRALLAEKEKRLQSLTRQVRSNNSASFTYAYLNRILNYAGPVKFDMVHSGSKEAEGFKYNVYRVKGEAFFKQFYKLIWYLERGPEIFKIQRLNASGLENRDPETDRLQLIVPFEMELWAVYSDVENVPPIKRTLRNVRVDYRGNPFKPLIYRNLASNKEGLVEPERAQLKGIVGKKAFVANYDGKIHILKEGDPVHLGYVARVDAQRNRVVFTLNKGGLVEQVTLELNLNETHEP